MVYSILWLSSDEHADVLLAWEKNPTKITLQVKLCPANSQQELHFVLLIMP